MVELAALQMFVIVQLDSRDVAVKEEFVKNLVRIKANVFKRTLVNVEVVIMELIVNLVNVLFLV